MLTTQGFQPDVLGLFEEVLSNGASLRVRVTGRSMKPFLRGGEVLTIRQVSCLSLGRGDLILFRNNDDLPVLHRIIKKRKSGDGTFCVLTKGDALMAFDGEITGERVLGKVFRIERTLRSGKTRHMHMNSLFYRGMNFLIAVLGSLKIQTYFFLSSALAKRT